MSSYELNTRMMQLTEEKREVMEKIKAMEAETQLHDTEKLRTKELQAWAKEHEAGFKEYDDIFTRKLIQEIIVINSDSIKIGFVDEQKYIPIVWKSKKEAFD